MPQSAPQDQRSEFTALKRGWTTGACAAAATKAALTALLTGSFPDPVEITLPKGQRVAFTLASESLSQAEAMAGIIKDAGDDPDITHGALVKATVRLTGGNGVTFRAGPGVGTVTRAGLPIPVGEASVTPTPRAMMTAVVQELGVENCEIELSIPGGEAMALKTLNPRLGVLGGLSILGTTGIVIPYSCSSWIHSIHRGVDVARAAGIPHLLASTGDNSERAANAQLNLVDAALIEMGDFAGGLLKYLARHPVDRLTIAGGIGKLSKLAEGHLDLHSGASQVNIAFLSQLAGKQLDAETAAQALAEAPEIANQIAQLAAAKAHSVAGIAVTVMVFDRLGTLVGQSATKV